MLKTQPPTLSALFVGNSFTFRNDLPGLIDKIAAIQGRTFQSQQIVAGGASLRAHWNAGRAVDVIRNGRFDAVILQEQSTLPIKNAKRFHENVRLFDDAIKAAGSRTVLYMTWARRTAPETQAVLTDAYRSIGAELNAAVVPAGVAWETVLNEPDAPVLHDKDDSHPSPAGSYLAACVFYAALFGASPVGAFDDELAVPRPVQARLQKVAWRVGKPKVAKARR